MRHTLVFVTGSVLAFVVGCGDNIVPGGTVDSRPGIDGPPLIDAPPGTVDGAVDGAVDAPPGAPDANVDAAMIDAGGVLAPHVLITEVDTDGNDEYVEIYNPTGVAVNLRNYHLSDANNYGRLPTAAATPLALDGSDFVVQFPIGASIAPGQVIVIATDAVGFEASYGSVPDFAIQEVGNAVAMDTAVAPTTGTVNPGFDGTGEMVALFRWNGMIDLVTDIDLVIAGNAPTAANAPVSRTGVAIDGPDAGMTPTSYDPDAMTIEDMASDTNDIANVLKTTYKRIAFEDGDELATGGNGLGHDETSEQLGTTWDSAALPTGYTAATPGVVPLSLQ